MSVVPSGALTERRFDTSSGTSWRSWNRNRVEAAEQSQSNRQGPLQADKTDCYDGWEEELRYFMCRYEEHLAKNANQKFKNEQWDRIWAASPAQSVEHVHPQNPTAGGPWKGALGRGRGQKEAHVNRLGNLVLLPPGLNSKIGNREFSFKKTAYRETGLLLLGDVFRKNKWNKQAIEARERALISFATDAWADL